MVCLIIFQPWKKQWHRKKNVSSLGKQQKANTESRTEAALHSGVELLQGNWYFLDENGTEPRHYYESYLVLEKTP